eukprot:4276599-Pyramimonas_sp.AAC.1
MPQFENHPPFMTETVASFGGQCARRESESHILNTARPPHVKRLNLFKTSVRSTKAKTTC